MNRHLLFLQLFLIFLFNNVEAQSMPTKNWPGKVNLPLIIYISGDGGFNQFSTSLCTAIVNEGYQVLALDAKSYFWNKKTPGQSANDLMSSAEPFLLGNNQRKVILTGYSFGADVLPFIYNQLSVKFRQKILRILLLSPSGSTDFEIHWADMLGGNSKRTMDVLQEINNLGTLNTVLINGDDDESIQSGKVTLPNFNHEIIPGGHHYDGDIPALAKMMIKYF